MIFGLSLLVTGCLGDENAGVNINASLEGTYHFQNFSCPGGEVNSFLITSPYNEYYESEVMTISSTTIVRTWKASATCDITYTYPIVKKSGGELTTGDGTLACSTGCGTGTVTVGILNFNCDGSGNIFDFDNTFSYSGSTLSLIRKEADSNCEVDNRDNHLTTIYTRTQ